MSCTNIPTRVERFLPMNAGYVCHEFSFHLLRRRQLAYVCIFVAANLYSPYSRLLISTRQRSKYSFEELYIIESVA